MSDGCEAMIEVYTHVWTRCWRQPTEKHHALTRARGGRILDDAGETYHHIHLCHVHHAWADGERAYAAGILIDGYVSTVAGRVVYQGSDEYLGAKYPSLEQPHTEPLPHDRYGG